MSKHRVWVAIVLAVLAAAAIAAAAALVTSEFDSSQRDISACGVVKSTGDSGLARCIADSPKNPLLGDLLLNLGATLAGAVVIFILVDGLIVDQDRRIDAAVRDTQYRDRLLAQIRGGDSGIVGSAIEELRSAGILTDGSLAGMSLHGATLTEAQLDGAVMLRCDFSNAVLRGASLVHSRLAPATFTYADMTDANLTWSDLTAAEISDDQLRTIGTLWGATLPDGSRYDGRFSLDGDLDLAAQYGIDTENAESMRDFFSS